MLLNPSFSWREDAKRIAIKADFVSTLAILGHCPPINASAVLGYLGAVGKLTMAG